MNGQDHEVIKTSPHPMRVYIFSTLFLVIVGIATLWIVKTHKRPGQMTMLESQVMDMTVMKAPTGSVPVSLETVEAGVFGASVTYAGSVVPFSEQDVYPRVEGWIRDMYVYPGDSVKKGQLLARLISPDVLQRVSAADAESNAAYSTANSATAEIDKMRQMVKAAEASRQSAEADKGYRDSELSRMESLFKSGAVSKSELDQERAMNSAAHADLNKMQADVDAALSALNSMEKQRSSMNSMAHAQKARAAVEKVTAGYLELRSMTNGVVTERLVSPGTLARPGVAVLKIADIGKVRLQANVSQSDAARIAIGSPVEATSSRWPGKTFRSSVTTVFPASDITARTVVVESVFDNQAKSFFPGDFITMRIGTSEGNSVISVPDRAIIRWGNNGQPFVWTAVGGREKGISLYTCVMHPEVITHKPGKCPKCGMKLVPKKTGGKLTAHRSTVTTGTTNGDRTEIFSGLAPGDQVVIDGGTDLNEGDVLYTTKWSIDGPKEYPPAPAMEESGSMPGMDMSGNSKKNNITDMKGKNISGKNTSTNNDPKSKVVYTCPMHPEVKSDKPGHCPKCGMKLEKKNP